MKMLAKLSILICCSAIASACSTAGAVRGGTPHISPSVINSADGRYDGSEISLKGYVVIDGERHVVFESRSLFEELRRKYGSGNDFDAEDYEKYCVTIANPSKIIGADGELSFRKTMTIYGKYVSKLLPDDVMGIGNCSTPGGIIVEEVVE